VHFGYEVGENRPRNVHFGYEVREPARRAAGASQCCHDSARSLAPVTPSGEAELRPGACPEPARRGAHSTVTEVRGG